MSTALAIAGVTAVLRDLLNDGLINHNISGVIGSTVAVSVLPPDRVIGANGSEASQLNLFLHQVEPNMGWRNEGLPSLDGSGRQRLTNPPLALNLNYLLSAYSAADLHGEILLGYAMQLLHENAVISREAIRAALDPSPDVGNTLPQALRALSGSGLADQVEQLHITPRFLDTEEMSKLWTATQANYRLTAAYQVTVVLIEATDPTRSALPVLTRGPVNPVTGREGGIVVEPSLIPRVPVIEDVVPAGSQPVARLGEAIGLVGHHLDGTGRTVALRNDRFEVDEAIGASGASEPASMQFVIPNGRAADFPVGAYQISANVLPAGETAPRETNRLGLVLAPDLTNLPQAVGRDVAGTASFTLSFRPDLRANQTVSLLLGQQEFAPDAFVPPTNSLDFTIPDAPVGNFVARLRIGGIDSPIINRAVTPPEFLDLRVDIT